MLYSISRPQWIHQNYHSKYSKSHFHAKLNSKLHSKEPTVHIPHIDGLVQERRNSIANSLELRLSSTNPLIQNGCSSPCLEVLSIHGVHYLHKPTINGPGVMKATTQEINSHQHYSPRWDSRSSIDISSFNSNSFHILILVSHFSSCISDNSIANFPKIKAIKWTKYCISIFYTIWNEYLNEYI